MTWDPTAYLRFGDLRMRPGIELISRIPEVEVRSMVDLGCGTGALTAVLAERWPSAALTAVDASPEMLSMASGRHPSIEWIEDDIESWEPGTRPDVVFSNAALHWLDDHETLFRRIRSWVGPGGVIAIQMPNNWDAPTHTVPADLLDSGDWPDEAKAALLRNRVAEPSSYRRWLQPATIDIWETTYHQELVGEDPVLGWVQGSLLRPVLAAMTPAEANRFTEECGKLYARAYPADELGVTVLPFRRLFAVATAL